MKYFFDNGGLQFLNKVEKDFSCAGLCDVPLFYVTKDISLGPPKKECVEQMFIDITSSMSSLGMISLVAGIFTILGFFGTFSLCSNNSLDHEHEDNIKDHKN